MSAHQSATATHILISFCNSTTGSPSLGIVEIESGRTEILRVPAAVAEADARGIALSDRYVFVATGREKSVGRASRSAVGHSSLFVLDREDLGLVSSYRCERVLDAHSICAGDEHVDIVSTGSDEVVRLELRGPQVVSEEILWRADPSGPRADIHHLNAVCSWHDDIVVSGFGRKTDRLWVGRVPGYARGICRVDDFLFVGISKGRRVSNSTGALTNRADPGPATGQCALARLRIDTLAIEHVVDLNLMSWEIYDLVAVAGVEKWPVAGDIEWRDSVILGVREDYEERDQTVSWLHTEVAARDSEIRRLHEEVAKRDHTITWLHREVAERDRTIEHRGS